MGRLFEATHGAGFCLVVVEVATAADRDELRAWYGELLVGRFGVVRAVDLAALPGENPWRELKALGVPGPADVLFMWGLETTERRAAEPTLGLARKLNVQRDSLVRDFPVTWVLAVHPSLRQHLHTEAADCFGDRGSAPVTPPGYARSMATFVLSVPEDRPAFVSPALEGVRAGEGLDPAALAGKIVMINAWYEW